MGWRKKPEPADPFETRSKALAEQIRKLEKQIQDLAQIPAPPPAKPSPDPAFGSSPPSSTKASAPTASSPSRPASRASTSPKTLPKPPPPSPTGPAIVEPSHDTRINPQGVRKFDLTALWSRLLNHFRGPDANNPRMVQYLAAGSVHGLRPLRYERRVARNRFIGLFVLLVLILFGLAKVYFPSG